MKTKKLLIAFFSLAMLSFFVVQYGCKKDDNTPEDTDEIIISDKTNVVDTTVLTDFSITGNTYTYKYTGQQPDIKTGDIIIGPNNGGYLRKVASISSGDGEIQIQTEDAKIVDAIENGDFQKKIKLNLSSQKSGDNKNVLYLINKTKGVNVKDNIIDLDGVVLYNGEVGGADVSLTLTEGNVSFEPEIDFGFKIRKKKFKELHAYAEGGLDMNFKALLEANAEFTYENEINLATFKSYAVQFVGIVPIYEVFTLKFDAGFTTDNHLNGEASAGFNSNYNVKFGYLYTLDNGWEQIWEKSSDFTPYSPQGLFNADLHMNVYIKPSLTIEFYSVVGPGMDVVPYMDFTASAHNKDIYWNWNLIGGVYGNLNFNAHIFGYNIINYSHELFDWNKTIASDNGVITDNTPPTAIFTIDPTSGTTSTVFEFDASGSTDNEDPTSDLQVRWDFDGNGSWDTNWDTDKIVNHQYSNEDTYTAKMEVKDTEGLTDQATQNVSVTGGSNTPPTAVFAIDPSSGSTSTVFTFDASGSYDAEDPTSALQVRWDWENNGSWDTNWDTDKTVNHRYSNEGTYTAKMEVKDTEGLTDYTTHTVTVSNGGGSGGTFTDPRDGQVYNTVTIGNQTWMAENLRYLPSVSPSSNGSYDAPYYYVYDYQGTNVSEAKATDNYQTYGVLYNWAAAINACPSGWHLPSDEEWKTLEMALGMSQSEADDTGWRGTDEGGKMKETGTTHWNSPNTGATNTSGFTALPGGYRGNYPGSFDHLGRYGNWWSSTEHFDTDAWGRGLGYGRDQVARSDNLKTDGFSVRCLKD